MINDALARQLAPASFEGVDFPVVDVTTTDGHDSARHAGYLQAGADIETTGRKPGAIKLKIAFFEGIRGWPANLFDIVRVELVEAFQDNPYGQLIHPSRGPMQVHVDEWVEPLEGRVRNGCWLDVAMTEQRGASSLLDPALRPTDPATDLTTAAAAADAAAPPGVDDDPSVLDLVNAALEVVDAANATFLASGGSLSGLVAAVGDRLLAVAPFGADVYLYRIALERTLAAALTLQSALASTGGGPRTFTVPTPLSIQRIAGLPQVYGDPTRARDLLDANAITDPLFVPAGTVLIVLD